MLVILLLTTSPSVNPFGRSAPTSRTTPFATHLRGAIFDKTLTNGAVRVAPLSG